MLHGERNVSEGLADFLEPRTPRTGELAFADTIHIDDLDLGGTGEDLSPASHPVFVNDPSQSTQWMTPFAFPLPSSAQEVSFSTKLRVLHSRILHFVRGWVEEANDAWSQTQGAASFPERVKALWSLWQWERGDLVRAALMGSAVFFVVATLGAIAMASGDEPAAQAFGVLPSNEVRAPRTVDQHTGRAFHASPALRERVSRR
jgi:hypothetical protein